MADTVCLLTSNALLEVTDVFGIANPWSFEKTFKKLESSGMLAQYIRVSTIPQEDDSIEFPMCIASKVYEELTACTVFLKKDSSWVSHVVMLCLQSCTEQIALQKGLKS